MQYFLETVDTIDAGVGFSLFGTIHLAWIGLLAVAILINCLWFRKLSSDGRNIWKKTIAVLLLLDELFKTVILLIAGQYNVEYLPLHLCSINIFMITLHAWRPSASLDNFLYTVCIPGALAALLFPAWTELPVLNAMHLHSFTVHILLMLYPVVLTVNKEIRPNIKMLPKSLGLLGAMAVVIYVVNLLLDTNFMFLMYAEPGNPLYWFGQNWGNHLLGFPVIIVGVMMVMYLPIELHRKRQKR